MRLACVVLLGCSSSGPARDRRSIQAAAEPTDAEISRDRTDIDASGHLAFTLPANGLAVFHLIAQ